MPTTPSHFFRDGELRPLVGQLDRRLRNGLVVENETDLRLLQKAGDLLAEARSGQVPVEDDERPAHLQLREVLRQAGETPVSENDLFGARKRKCLHGLVSPFSILSVTPSALQRGRGAFYPPRMIVQALFQ